MVASVPVVANAQTLKESGNVEIRFTSATYETCDNIPGIKLHCVSTEPKIGNVIATPGLRAALFCGMSKKNEVDFSVFSVDTAVDKKGSPVAYALGYYKDENNVGTVFNTSALLSSNYFENPESNPVSRQATPDETAFITAACNKVSEQAKNQAENTEYSIRIPISLLKPASQTLRKSNPSGPSM